MVAHPAGELHALLFELIQQSLDALGLLADVCAGHPARITVGVDQAQLLQSLRHAGRLYDAGGGGKLIILLGQQGQRREARCPETIV